GQSDPDEADRAVAQHPRRRHSHHLVGCVAVPRCDYVRHGSPLAQGSFGSLRNLSCPARAAPSTLETIRVRARPDPTACRRRCCANNSPAHKTETLRPSLRRPRPPPTTAVLPHWEAHPSVPLFPPRSRSHGAQRAPPPSALPPRPTSEHCRADRPSGRG